MTIQTDFDSYKTVDGYLNPNPVPPGTIRGSDNQLMFTSEYILILKYNQVLQPIDALQYVRKVYACIKNEYIYRTPQDTEIDLSPDDHVGVYAAMSVLAPEFGSLYGTIPKLPLILYRQPQLLLLKWAAEGHIPLLGRVLSPIAAIIIATSCHRVPTGDTDSRRLSWLLIQGLAPHSWLCRQAAKIWYKRLYRDYSAGMKNVASIYYQPQGIEQNPYSKYWIDKAPNSY